MLCGLPLASWVNTTVARVALVMMRITMIMKRTTARRRVATKIRANAGYYRLSDWVSNLCLHSVMYKRYQCI